MIIEKMNRPAPHRKEDQEGVGKGVIIEYVRLLECALQYEEYDPGFIVSHSDYEQSLK